MTVMWCWPLLSVEEWEMQNIFFMFSPKKKSRQGLIFAVWGMQYIDEQWPGHIALVAVFKTTRLVPYPSVKSLQFIWRTGASQFYVLTPSVQASWKYDRAPV